MFQRLFLILVLAMANGMVPANAVAAADDWQPLLDVAFEQNNPEMAFLILVNDNNVPVSDIIVKARQTGYGYTRIIDALIDTKLSHEQVMIEALRNGAPPSALFESKKISDDLDYTPELILQFLVTELRFMARTEAELGEKDDNRDTRNANREIIIRVCKSMLEEENFSQFDVMTVLCQSEASDDLIAEVAKRFNIPGAVTFRACPKHAEYGHAYISHDLPQEAYIIIGVDHQTLDDNAGNGNDVISPKRP